MMKIFSCLAVGLLFCVSSASAETLIFQRDFDGDSGATHVGWERHDITDLDVGLDFSTTSTVGGHTVTINGTGNSMAALDRGGPDASQPNYDVYQDATYTTRNTANGFGRHYLQVVVSGLEDNTDYRVIPFHYDQNNAGADGWMAWGLENPAAWLDANVGPGESYQPAEGGINNPIPTLARGPMTGPWPGNFFDEPELGGLHYTSPFWMTSSGTGTLTFYGWADADSYSTQDISMINGLRITIPEPASMILLGLGGLMLAGVVRRRR
jgi:hypothetical protein